MSAQTSDVKYEEPSSPTKVESAAKLDEECAIEDGDKLSPILGPQQRKFSMNDPLPVDLKPAYMPVDQSIDNQKRRGSESWHRTIQTDVGSRLAMMRRNAD